MTRLCWLALVCLTAVASAQELVLDSETAETILRSNPDLGPVLDSTGERLVHFERECLRDRIFATDGTLQGTRALLTLPDDSIVGFDGRSSAAGPGRVVFVVEADRSPLDPELWWTDGLTGGPLDLGGVYHALLQVVAGDGGSVILLHGPSFFEVSVLWTDGTQGGTVLVGRHAIGFAKVFGGEQGTASAASLPNGEFVYALSGANDTSTTVHHFDGSASVLLGTLPEVRIQFAPESIGGRALCFRDEGPAWTVEPSGAGVQALVLGGASSALHAPVVRVGADWFFEVSSAVDRDGALARSDGSAPAQVVHDMSAEDAVRGATGSSVLLKRGMDAVCVDSSGIATTVASDAVGEVGEAERIGNDCYFQIGTRIARTDGSVSGTTILSDGVWAIRAIESTGSGITFVGQSFAEGLEPWYSDGTASGTGVFDCSPGTRTLDGSFVPLVRYRDRLVARKHGLLGPDTVWSTDGTPGSPFGLLGSDVDIPIFGAGLALDDWLLSGKTVYRPAGGVVAPFPFDFETSSSDWWELPHPLARDGDRILIVSDYRGAGPAPTGDGVYWTNGTDAGTSLVAPLASPLHATVGSLGEGLGIFLVRPTTALFSELWRTDGTAAGTYSLASSVDDLSGTRCAFYGGFAYFVRRTPGGSFADQELWRTDGSAGGTELVTNLPWTEVVDHVRSSRNGLLLLYADDRLEVHDGAPQAQPTLLMQFPENSGFQSSRSGLAYLWQTGGSLWCTDGTAAGTTVIGTAPASPNYPIITPRPTEGLWKEPVLDEDLFVLEGDLWITDGSQVGTRRLLGPTTCDPGDPAQTSAQGVATPIVRVGDHLYFSARAEATGRELYRLALADVPGSARWVFGTSCSGSDGSRPRIELVGDLEVAGGGSVELTLRQARAGAPAALLLSPNEAAAPVATDCRVYVGEPFSATLFATDALGALDVNVPLLPVMAGLHHFAQWIVFDPGAAGLGSFAATPGLEVVFGP